MTFVTSVLLFFEKNAKIVTNLPQGCSTPLKPDDSTLCIAYISNDVTGLITIAMG